jgi:hypothetical protein
MIPPLDIIDWDLRWGVGVFHRRRQRLFSAASIAEGQELPLNLDAGKKAPQMGDHDKSLDWLNEIAPVMSNARNPSPEDMADMARVNTTFRFSKAGIAPGARTPGVKHISMRKLLWFV